MCSILMESFQLFDSDPQLTQLSLPLPLPLVGVITDQT